MDTPMPVPMVDTGPMVPTPLPTDMDTEPMEPTPTLTTDTERGPLMLSPRLRPRLTPLSSTPPPMLSLPRSLTPASPRSTPASPQSLTPASPRLSSPRSLSTPSTRPPPTVSPLPTLDSSTLPTLESALTTSVSRWPAKQYNWTPTLLRQTPTWEEWTSPA